jgi:transcriptional regulator with XRE-family HTH domain
MSELSAKIAALKGSRRTSHLVRGADVSRATFRKIELGQSIKLSTLKEIAKALTVDESAPEWLDLLVAWIKSEVGYDSRKLWIEPRAGSSTLHDAAESETARAMMLFEQLNAGDRAQIVKAMQRPEVRACLPAINRIWEKVSAPKPVSSTPAHMPSSDPSAPVHLPGFDKMHQEAVEKGTLQPPDDKARPTSTTYPHRKGQGRSKIK